MNEIKKYNDNQTTEEDIAANLSQFNFNHLKLYFLLATPLILALSGLTIWNSLNDIGLPHLFLETIKSNATLYTVSAFLIVVSYVVVVCILLLILSIISIYHRVAFFGYLAVFLALCCLIAWFLVFWCLWRWDGLVIAFIISYFLMAILFIYDLETKQSIPYKQKKFNQNLLASFLMLTVGFSIVIVFYQSKSNHFILYMASFSQTPSKSTWYVLDENYIKKFKLKQPLLNNGVQTSQLEHIKEKFIKTNGENESILPIDNSLYLHHPNALYGYFLWRAGETRVFCPKSFNIKTIDKNHDKAVASNCLIIKEQYIQPSAWIQ